MSTKFPLLLLLLFVLIKHNYGGIMESKIKYDPEEVEENINLILFSNKEKSEVIPLTNIENILESKIFDSKKITMIYCPGYIEELNATTINAIISAYLNQYKQYNVILIDWTKYSMLNYLFESVPSSYAVGKAVANGIEKLITAGLQREKFHMIGHSLGAQIVGTIGRNMLQPLPLIVGLDPAGPGFGKLSKHLSRADGNYTIAIHTDRGVYGTLFNDAHLDLLINGGNRYQPGCSYFTIPFSLSEKDLCSHQRSVYYWADIITNPETYFALDCNNNNYFKKENCSPDNATMISPELRGISGIYYLQTSSTPPYGKGKLGI